MEEHLVKIESIQYITRDVLQIVTEKPERYSFTPGQATEVAINNKDWRDKKRPFTFSGLPDKDYLEFTIKTYPLNKGVTNELTHLNTDDELILHDIFGTIVYRGEGVFIAGGSGITPFISIFRHLKAENKIGNNRLIFANKTKDDIILAREFRDVLGDKFINILSDEKVKGYAHGLITKEFLLANIGSNSQTFYMCGPPLMMGAVEYQLLQLNVDIRNIVKEEF
jgi:ferredoxin-NADP reductase